MNIKTLFRKLLHLDAVNTAPRQPLVIPSESERYRIVTNDYQYNVEYLYIRWGKLVWEHHTYRDGGGLTFAIFNTLKEAQEHIKYFANKDNWRVVK